jgi:hypothetical protein
MGHLTGKEEILRQLRERLDKNPIGLPEHTSLFEILSILFTEKEAELGARFPFGVVGIEEIQKTTGKDRNELEEILEGMMKKGLVVTVKRMARSNTSFPRLLSASSSLPSCVPMNPFL